MAAVNLCKLIVGCIILVVVFLEVTDGIFISNESNKLEKMVEMQLEHIKQLVQMTDDGNRHRRELITITKKQVGMIDDMLEHMKKKDKKDRRAKRPKRKKSKKRKKGQEEEE